jgi:hypothetical protein
MVDFSRARPPRIVAANGGRGNASWDRLRRTNNCLFRGERIGLVGDIAPVPLALRASSVRSSRINQLQISNRFRNAEVEVDPLLLHHFVRYIDR